MPKQSKKQKLTSKKAIMPRQIEQWPIEKLQPYSKNPPALALTQDAAWYMWHPMLLQGYFAAAAAAAAAAGLIIHRQIIWVKPVLLLGRGQYHWKHELCFMGWIEGHQPPDYGRGGGERDQTTVWEIAGVTQQERKDFNHSTPKPVELFSIPITKHLKPGEICYEPFAGSGSQFVAAEQLGRVCYGMEIEPKYVAVCLERLAALGLKPKLNDCGAAEAHGRDHGSKHARVVPPEGDAGNAL